MTDDPRRAAAVRLVDALLAVLDLSAAAPAREYSSIDLPPGISREAYHARCRRIPEARKDGRIWRCPVDAYERSLTHPAARSRARTAPIASPPANDSAEQLLAAAGVRLRGPR